MKIRNYFRPKNFEEFYEIRHNYPNNKILAGGTFVSRQNFPKTDTLIDIQDLKLSYVLEDNDNLIIGSMATFTELIENYNTLIGNTLLSSLKRCGPITIRNIATIGGNIMGGYYWNDTTPVLLFFNAKLKFLEAPLNEMVVHIRDFISNRAQYNKYLLKEIILDKKQLYNNVFYNRFSRTEVDIPTSIFLGGKINDNEKIVIGASINKPIEIVNEYIDVNLLDASIKNVYLMNDLRGSDNYKYKIIMSQFKMYMEWKNENKN